MGWGLYLFIFVILEAMLSGTVAPGESYIYSKLSSEEKSDLKQFKDIYEKEEHNE